MPFLCFNRFKLSGLRRDTRDASAFKRRHCSRTRLQCSARSFRTDYNLFFDESRFCCGAGSHSRNREAFARRNLGFSRRVVCFRCSAKSAVLSVYNFSSIKTTTERRDTEFFLASVSFGDCFKKFEPTVFRR